ncbi:MAG: LapA family protein [bacterium]|nr:MAG: LapA family protein [bacterium]
MKYVYATLILLLALTLAAFIQQNSQTTILRYFTWESPALPLSLYMVVAFAAGYLLATLLGFTGGIRRKVKYSVMERENRKLKDELALRETASAGETVLISKEEETAPERPEGQGDRTAALSAPSPGGGEGDEAGEEEI